MKNLIRILCVVALIISAGTARAWTGAMMPSLGESSPKIQRARTDQQNNEVTVWVNTRSGVYHCSGSRWYGNTKTGRFMSECEARADGFRPAYGSPCGSICN